MMMAVCARVCLRACVFVFVWLCGCVGCECTRGRCLVLVKPKLAGKKQHTHT